MGEHRETMIFWTDSRPEAIKKLGYGIVSSELRNHQHAVIGYFLKGVLSADSSLFFLPLQDIRVASRLISIADFYSNVISMIASRGLPPDFSMFRSINAVHALLEKLPLEYLVFWANVVFNARRLISDATAELAEKLESISE